MDKIKITPNNTKMAPRFLPPPHKKYKKSPNLTKTSSKAFAIGPFLLVYEGIFVFKGDFNMIQCLVKSNFES